MSKIKNNKKVKYRHLTIPVRGCFCPIPSVSKRRGFHRTIQDSCLPSLLFLDVARNYLVGECSHWSTLGWNLFIKISSWLAGANLSKILVFVSFSPSPPRLESGEDVGKRVCSSDSHIPLGGPPTMPGLEWGGDGISRAPWHKQSQASPRLHHDKKASALSHLPIPLSFSQLVRNSKGKNSSTLLGPSNPKKYEKKVFIINMLPKILSVPTRRHFSHFEILDDDLGSWRTLSFF